MQRPITGRKAGQGYEHGAIAKMADAMLQGGTSGRTRGIGEPTLHWLAYERLSEAEKRVWRTVVSATRPDWLTQVPALVLAAYCRHVVQMEILGCQVSQVDPASFATPQGLRRFGQLIGRAERERRAMMTCARALGLGTPALNAVYHLLWSERATFATAMPPPARLNVGR
jgi:hypothetical protein